MQEVNIVWSWEWEGKIWKKQHQTKKNCENEMREKWGKENYRWKRMQEKEAGVEKWKQKELWEIEWEWEKREKKCVAKND